VIDLGKRFSFNKFF